MENNYYCLVAGLPDITVEDTKLKMSLTEFKDELQLSLLPEDKKFIDLFFLKFDNQNLLNILLKKDSEFNPLGNFSADELEGLIKQVKADGILADSPFPIYMQQFLLSFHEELIPENEHDLSLALISGFYQHAQETSNEFIASFYEFEQNLWNVISAINCRKFEVTTEKEIIGNNEISKLLKKSSAKDFGLAHEFDLIEKLLQISEEPNLLEREKKVDTLRWEILDDDTFFHYFTIERIFAYLVKLEILERWTRMDVARGQEEFNNIVNTLESSFEVPAEF